MSRPSFHVIYTENLFYFHFRLHWNVTAGVGAQNDSLLQSVDDNEWLRKRRETGKPCDSRIDSIRCHEICTSLSCDVVVVVSSYSASSSHSGFIWWARFKRSSLGSLVGWLSVSCARLSVSSLATAPPHDVCSLQRAAANDTHVVAAAYMCKEQGKFLIESCSLYFTQRKKFPCWDLWKEYIAVHHTAHIWESLNHWNHVNNFAGQPRVHVLLVEFGWVFPSSTVNVLFSVFSYWFRHTSVIII